MKVLVLTPYLYGTTPGPRSSIELWERVLKPAGVSFEYAPFESRRLHEVLYQPGRTGVKVIEMLGAYRRRVPTVRDVDRFDAVLVNREAALIGPALFEKWIARKGKPIIYLLDDPLYIPYRSPSNGYLSYLKCFGKVGKLCRMSRVVIVNSAHHRDYAIQFNANVRQIPSLVDGDRFRFERRNGNGNGPVCVGWSGSASTVGNLRVIEDVLRALGEREEVRLHFIGAERVGLAGVRCTSQPWSAATEVEDLRLIDVGLLPLPVDEWTKRKFYLKLVQYMALGIPAVCTPLGSNPYVVDHGSTGFLARSQAEWQEAIEQLVADPKLRLEMGERAARVARERYTLQANTDIIIDAFRAAVR